MSKRLEDLAFKYNINASVDELSLFVSEVYNDGYNEGKEKQEPMTGSEIHKAFCLDKDAINAESYWAGVEQAEKHHGINAELAGAAKLRQQADDIELSFIDDSKEMGS